MISQSPVRKHWHLAFKSSGCFISRQGPAPRCVLDPCVFVFASQTF
jgi:hypothetical protein